MGQVDGRELGEQVTKESTVELIAGAEGTEGWVEVWTVEDGGYEWDFTGLWYSPSARRFFGYTASGCSCNDWTDWFSVSECADGNKQWALGWVDSVEAKTAVREFNTKTLQ